ncbi:tyrosine-type recombinase/integrase [Burkholderia stagnalis]|uniref:tyrosine-type recombinase/integrase n=1 Tax=Burkholderia stagnalis TaxID=1503054 RepID=UPI000F56A0A2|nr:site-specific integrase [Burkholderia stagnalis]RQQ37099.1 site-specific integrase [Burkholderia stagnalis]RQQ55614.1 site-specific integrase [Burkholderia stagnalis]RQY19074.1 site-specific integrase [Burkholderia stagnalis]RQY64240.1 site-specific integrase [Burkholderia stagnalis]RQY70427.1 site-specific integrase [Burkholderia stagnalis]
MPIETITKNGRRRFRWTFERVIEGSRIRKTKLIPAGLSAREADELGRKWDAEVYATATGARRPIVTIGECVRIHVGDRSAGWKDRKTRIQILTKYAPEYEDQDALELYDWSIKFAGFMRANTDRQGHPKKPMSDGTIHNTLGYIRAAIKYAHKIGKLEYDQTAKMVIPKPSEERHVYKGRREMLQIAKQCTNRQARAAIRTAFYSGMRMSEILRAIPTKDGFSLGSTKNGRPRLIPIHPRIAVIARRVTFTIPAWKLKEAWEKARTKAGHPDVRFHDLRHSAASEMINAGIDLYTVGGVLGHKTTTSTKRYAHLVTDKLAEAVKKIGRS